MKRVQYGSSIAVVTGLLLIGCAKKSSDRSTSQGPIGTLSGTVRVDGSSTVFPITEAVAEEFQKQQPNVRVTVGISGTGGGFKKFCNGEIQVANASRPIRPTEVELCSKNRVKYLELPIAYDGLAVMVNQKNTWANHLTTEELKTIWAPESQGKVTRWKDVRSGWPDKPLRLYGPGVDSGTYDYFTEAINHKEHSSRGDFTSSEDDNVIVQGIAGDESALGFFGYAYFEQSKEKLKALAVDDGNPDNGAGPVLPSIETVRGGTYQPLSRPIFLYISLKALDRAEIKAFAKYYLSSAAGFSREVGYVPLPERAYTLGQSRVDRRIQGSLFGGKGSQVGVLIEELLEKESR